jgi:apolipoprotein N-acyltransferase
MMIDWLSVALAIVGVVGIGGAIALFFLAPSLLEVLFAGVQKMFGALLATRLGCALLAAAAAGIAADQYREHAAAAQCRAIMAAREQEAEQRAQQRDRDQAALAGSDARQRLAALERQSTQDQETIDALRAADQACHPLTADQLR